MTEQAVRQVAQKGCDAIKKDDYKDFLKVADVPWCSWDNNGDCLFVRTREDLSEWLRRHFGGTHPFKSVTTKKAIPYKEYRKKVSHEDQKMLDQALTPSDWVVWFTLTGPEGTEWSYNRLFVAWRDGQWKIVGFDGRDND